jgi:hypothetical protein
LSTDIPGDLDVLLARIGEYITKRHDSLKSGSLGLVFDGLKVYRDSSDNEPYAQIDVSFFSTSVVNASHLMMKI